MSNKVDPVAPNNSSSKPETMSDDLKHEQEVAQEAMKSQYHPIILSDLSTQRSTSFWRGYKLFWPFLKPYWVLAVVGVLLTIPVGALDAVIALF